MRLRFLPASNGRWTNLNQNLARCTHALGPLGRAYDSLYFEYCQRWATRRPKPLDELRRFPSADVIRGPCTRPGFRRRAERPFFLYWLHLMDPHAPYYPKQEALDLMGTRCTPFQARYLNSGWNRSDLSPSGLQRYRDEIVALYDAWGFAGLTSNSDGWLASCKKSAVWNEWPCLQSRRITAKNFSIMAGRFHPPSRAGEELLHVPLLLRVPGVGKRAVAPSPFSLMHLSPTYPASKHLDLAAPAAFRRAGATGTIYATLERPGTSLRSPNRSLSAKNPFHRENRLGSACSDCAGSGQETCAATRGWNS